MSVLIRKARPALRRPWAWALGFTACAAVIVLAVVFAPPRLGAADNGDFYRIAARMGVDGTQRLSGSEWPYFHEVNERWLWQEMDWRQLTPSQASFSAVWPVSLVRLITNLFSGTAETPLSTAALALVYMGMLLVAVFLLTRFALIRWRLRGLLLMLPGAVMLLGSMHLAWLNSLYGETMLYVGLLLTLGCFLTAVSARSPAAQALWLLPCGAAAYLLCCGKPQAVLAWPLWMALLAVLAVRALRRMNRRRMLTWLCAVLLVVQTVWSGLCCLNLYRWNSELNESATLFSALFDGILTLTDDPEAMLEDMGLDPALAADVGKNGYSDPNDMVAPPYSDRGREMIDSKINTLGLLKYYVTHPAYLLEALEITAQQAVEPAIALHHFVGEAEAAHTDHTRFGLWARVRPHVTPRHFWQYVLLYGGMLAVCALRLRRAGDGRSRLMTLVFLAVLFTGVLQYPLPFLGNGYADTNKQLYLFMLCHDVCMLWAACFLVCRATQVLHRRFVTK